MDLKAGESKAAEWFLLLYQLPASNSSLRVKIWRKLLKIGAVGIKTSAYLLPAKVGSEEDFQWIRREVIDGGGEAFLFRSWTFSAHEGKEIVELFRKERAADYEMLRAECSERVGQIGHLRGQEDEAVRQKLASDFPRLRARLAEIETIDFFKAPGHDAASRAIGTVSALLDRSLHDRGAADQEPAELAKENFQRKIWVTRTGLHVDRLACSWFIRRYIDADARFEFVASDTMVDETNIRIPFDTYGARIGHHGDWCSFETIIRAFRFDRDPILMKIAALVHDVDLKDGKFGVAEAAGFDLVLIAMRKSARDDSELLEQGCRLYDSLFVTYGADLS